MSKGLLHFYDETRFIGTNGLPVSATSYFYYSGTSNLAPIYAEEGLITPLTNPVVTAVGAIPVSVFLDPTIKYRRRIVFSDGSVQDSDPLSLTATTSGSIEDYISILDPTVSGYPDISAALARASLVTTKIYGKPGAIYYVKDAALDGRHFEGNGCVLRDAPGSRWGIKITGYAPRLSNFIFQDQGTYVSSTTLSAGMAAASTTAVVTSAAGIEIGDVIFINLDANELRHQTFVTNVVGNTVTIRDAIPSAAAAGRSVEAMVSAIRVGAADHWSLENIIVVNARGALLTMPETIGTISNRGSMKNFQTDSCRYFGWIKAGDCAGVKASDIKLWCGFVETFNHTGNGTAGPFSFVEPVFLLRDVTVTVNGINQVYGTDWNFASQTSIQFLAGHLPANGASIVISHFRDGYRGFVEDQRNTAIISGGNLYDAVECLDAFIGASFFESDLTEVRSLIADSCQYVATQLSACTNTLVFSGDTFCGFSGSSLKVFGSIPRCFNSLYTYRAPLSYTWLTTQDDNVYIDSVSELRIAASGWSGEFQHTAQAGGLLYIVGGQLFRGRNTANVAAGSTVYLYESGATANINDSGWRSPRKGTLKTARVDVDTAPGAGQSYTYEIVVGGITVGTIVISGASSFSGTANLNSFVTEGQQINLSLITSAGAAAGTRHFIQTVLV